MVTDLDRFVSEYKHTTFSKNPLLIVSNLHYHTTANELKKFLTENGAAPVRLKIVYRGNRSLGICGVQYDTEDRVDEVAALMNGKIYNYQPIYCRRASAADRKLFMRRRKDTLNIIHLSVDCITAEDSTTSTTGEFQVVHLRDLNLKDAIQRKFNNDFSKVEFYVIDFELAITLKKGQCIPNEVAIAKFSFSFEENNGGEVARYHRFIHPGSIPESVIKLADYPVRRVHGIPLPHDSFPNKEAEEGSTTEETELIEFEKDYTKIWTEICQFLGFEPQPIRKETSHENENAAVDDRHNVLLFAKGPHAENYCLNWLAAKANSSCPLPRVMDIDELLDVCFKVQQERNTNNNSNSSSEDPPETWKHVTKHICAFEMHTDKCDFHQQLNSMFHCALQDVLCIGKFLCDTIPTTFPLLFPRRSTTTPASRFL